MIQTGNAALDAVVAELEANVLGQLEANVTKAGEIAKLRAQVAELEDQVKKLKQRSAKATVPS